MTVELYLGYLVAQTAPNPTVLGTGTSVLVDIGLLNLISATLIPILVDAVTHWQAQAWVKTMLATILASIASLVTQASVNGGLLQWKLLILSVVSTVLLTGVTHVAFLKPLGVTGAAGVIQQVTGGAGIGAPPGAGPPPSPAAPPAG